MKPELVLKLDLTEKSSEVEERPELFERYLGGAGVAIQLLKEYCPQGVDPFAPEAPIVMAVGPLTAAFPCCSKVVSMFKSPVTGNLGESHAGGRLGLAIRTAGYGAIVITGSAPHPVYVSIHDDEVSFNDATTLWGISTYSTGRVLAEIEKGAGRRSIIRIGPAGEKRIRFANVNVDTFRHFGRLGLGAVFGSKKLKALVISGSKSFDVKRIEEYRAVYEEIYGKITRSDVMRKYHYLGTAENVLVLDELGALPTRNLQSSRFEEAPSISGETFAEKLLFRKIACPHCPIGCVHIAELRIQFAEGYEYGSMRVSYDYEPIYALGSMLGIGSPDEVLRLIEKVERYGLDAISTGVTLAWATEALERGLIAEEETMGLRLKWGDADAYAKAIDYIVEAPNKFYRILGKGVEAAAEVYGGSEFALALGRNEVAGYHCGPATLVGQLVGCRHSHLDNAGYSIDQAKAGTPEGEVRALIEEEQLRCMLTSLVICLFARKVYTEEVAAKALASLGIERTVEELRKLGRDIYREKLGFKFREGFSLEQLRVPRRFFEVPSLRGMIAEERVREMLRIYAEEVRRLLAADPLEGGHDPSNSLGG